MPSRLHLRGYALQWRYTFFGGFVYFVFVISLGTVLPLAWGGEGAVGGCLFVAGGRWAAGVCWCGCWPRCAFAVSGWLCCLFLGGGGWAVAVAVSVAGLACAVWAWFGAGCGCCGAPGACSAPLSLFCLGAVVVACRSACSALRSCVLVCTRRSSGVFLFLQNLSTHTIS